MLRQDHQGVDKDLMEWIGVRWIGYKYLARVVRMTVTLGRSIFLLNHGRSADNQLRQCPIMVG
jgi:hypothetical protein